MKIFKSLHFQTVNFVILVLSPTCKVSLTLNFFCGFLLVLFSYSTGNGFELGDFVEYSGPFALHVSLIQG